MIGLPGILFLIFLVLKLADLIDWSWWWVTAPLWSGFLLWCVLVFAGVAANLPRGLK